MKRLSVILTSLLLASCGVIDSQRLTITPRLRAACIDNGYLTEAETDSALVLVEQTRQMGVSKADILLQATQSCPLNEDPDGCRTCSTILIDQVYGS